MNLDHLNLGVRDAAACRAFYETHFGFWLAFESDGGYFVTNDDEFLLALMSAAPHQPLPDRFHIGFSVPTAERVVLAASEPDGGRPRCRVSVDDVQGRRPVPARRLAEGRVPFDSVVVDLRRRTEVGQSRRRAGR